MRDADAIQLLLSRKHNHALPQPFYTDPGLFEIDLQQVWYKEWLFALPACEIPKTGNYVTMQVGAYPVVVVRGADKKIRAFHNTCRHRGQRICSKVKGSAPKLVCPYHQWTYELDGKLLWAKDMGPDFDASKFSLKEVHCREAGGMVFVCLADIAPAFDMLAEKMQAYIGPHRLEDTKVAFESTIVEKGNWKLVIENNRECYHCGGSHPSLCRTYSDSPTMTAMDGPDSAAPEIMDHWARCEDSGLPSRFTNKPDFQWRLARIPLLNNAESFTMNTKAAVSKRMGDVPFNDAGSLLFYHYPNSWNHFLADHAIVFRVLPISPQETLVTTKWLVHKDAVEGVDYDLQKLTEVWIATNDEDRQVVEENQYGINSPAYEPGPYSTVVEEGVIQFVDWYCGTMMQRLTGRGVMAAE
ncbi:aromatic ring-hydroxylating oxygenase subunit alpha [Frigidibacter oleivorans]|uniref:aromatic ring-hydroxylating oxygenase subunit alpha n=1 Tax=Frigidibacter oleivorans TaxID=2487129 RepID=UPI000F8EBBB4|nr:aromatic ring-hydroxylating dioxygenase subunit alpha [Frigidibacter oleivorans]